MFISNRFTDRMVPKATFVLKEQKALLQLRCRFELKLDTKMLSIVLDKDAQSKCDVSVEWV